MVVAAGVSLLSVFVKCEPKKIDKLAGYLECKVTSTQEEIKIHLYTTFLPLCMPSEDNIIEISAYRRLINYFF